MNWVKNDVFRRWGNNYGNQKIHSKMNAGDFFNRYSSETRRFVNEDSERYHFKKPQTINGEWMWVRLLFKNKIISKIEMKIADPKLENSYDNWSDDKLEIGRKYHDEWLIDQLGNPSERTSSGIKYTYVWGEVLSYYDPRSGEIGIIISYF